MTQEIQNRSSIRYLLPIFFGIIGGIIAYFVIKQDDPKKAKNCLILGFVLTAIQIILYAVMGLIGSSMMMPMM